jgi:signal transduction histidine kinase
VNESLRHVVDLLNAQGVLRRVSMRLELANESPRVYGERHDLEQVFVNLLLNAAHAVEPTGAVTIRTTCASRATLEAGWCAPVMRRAPRSRTCRRRACAAGSNRRTDRTTS